MGVKSEANAFYKELAHNINRTLGRKAVSADRIRRGVKQAKQIRRTGGMTALLHFARGLAERLFSPEEVEKLKQSPRYREYSHRMIDLLVWEEVITRTEALMLIRAVR